MSMCSHHSTESGGTSGFVHVTLPYDSNWRHVEAQLRDQQLCWVRFVSCGSFGEVHELRDQQTDDTHYAWKRVDTVSAHSLLKKKKSTVKPDNEITILEHLTHPNIVKLFRSWVSDVDISLLFEMCTEDLFHKLQRDGPMGRTIGCIHMTELLEALTYLHNQKVAHRDVKLENILVIVSHLKPDVLKLSDFGLARVCSRVAGCKTLVGSKDYLAPEVREETTYGYACDVWSLGVVAYAMLTALSPYGEDADNRARLLGCIEPDARVSTGGKLPPVVFIQSCMTVAPEHRKDPSALAAWLWD